MGGADVGDLTAFAAVARARGFRGAAAAGHGSASALSEAVRRLEERLGVRLLNRTTRSVTPTEAGARLLERLAPALAELDAALDAVNVFRDKPVGVLRLNAPAIVARFVLPPIATAFLDAHPGVRLEVAADDDFRDVIGAGFDAGVRYEERLDRDMIAVPLGPPRQRFATAAAPAYLAARGAPAHPRDLLRHDCIRHRFPSGALADWEFERDGETVRVEPTGRLTAGSLDLERAAAVAGLGIVSTFEEALADDLSAGRLVAVLPDWWQWFSGPFLYYPSRRLVPAPLRAFVQFLRSGRAAGRLE